MKNIDNNNLYRVCGIKENYGDSGEVLVELRCVGAKRSFYCLPKDIKYFKNQLSKEDVKYLRKLELTK